MFELNTPSSELVRKHQVRQVCEAVTAVGGWETVFAMCACGHAQCREDFQSRILEGLDNRTFVAAAAAATGNVVLVRALQHAVGAAWTSEKLLDVQFPIKLGADPTTIQHGPLLALEICCSAHHYLKIVNAKPDEAEWRNLWKTKRAGTSTPYGIRWSVSTRRKIV